MLLSLLDVPFQLHYSIFLRMEKMKARNELEVQKLHKQGSIFSNISVENKEHYSQFNSERKKKPNSVSSAVTSSGENNVVCSAGGSVTIVQFNRFIKTYKRGCYILGVDMLGYTGQLFEQCWQATLGHVAVNGQPHERKDPRLI